MAGLKRLNENGHDSATLLNRILNLEIHLVLALSLIFSQHFYGIVIFILTWYMIALIEYYRLITANLQYRKTQKYRNK